MTPQELAQEGRRLSNLLDASLERITEQVTKAATAERDYRKARGEAWVTAKVESAGTAKAKEDAVDSVTADLRFARDLASGMERAAREEVRARLAQMSLLQSVANAFRAEAEFARSGA